MSDVKKPEDQSSNTAETEPTDDNQLRAESPALEADSVSQQHDNKPSKIPPLLALVALICVGALGYWSYTEFQKLRDKQAAASAQLADEIASKNSSMRSQITKLEAELARLDDEREAQNLLLERTQTRLSDAIKQVEAGRSTSETDWRLAEAQYLLRLANQRVLMERRPEGALTLLRSADKVIADLDDLSLYSLRQSIAQDIAKLEALPKLDVEGTYLRLAALIEQARELPTLSLEQQRQLPELLQEITPAALDETLKQDVQSALGRALSSLENLVVIQRHDRAVEPLLSPEQGHYLRQNLQLLLEQAQLALLRQQQTIFTTSIDRTTDLLTRYFDAENSTYQAMSQALGQLKTLQVSPQMPNISGSLETLQQHIADLTRLGSEAQR